MIYLDRPFSVGDWVRSPDQEIEGTVEDIGWRLTRIRTFDKRPLYIPNCVFANISVENPSRMSHRRIFETIGIRYSDIDKIDQIVHKVRCMLRDHRNIDSSETLIVNFNQFSSSSIDFFVYTFTRTTDWIDFHQVKQEILLNISDIIISEGAEVAFPTTTINLSEEVSSDDVTSLSIKSGGAGRGS
jgi:MscS family membrane protein